MGQYDLTTERVNDDLVRNLFFKHNANVNNQDALTTITQLLNNHSEIDTTESANALGLIEVHPNDAGNQGEVIYLRTSNASCRWPSPTSPPA